MSGYQESMALADAWAEVARAAATIGIDCDHPGFAHKSIDELLSEINERVPEGVTSDDLVRAEMLRTGKSQMAAQTKVHYVVEHLRRVGGDWQWVPVDGSEDEGTARRMRDDFAEQAEEMDEESSLYRAVKVTLGVVLRDVVA